MGLRFDRYLGSAQMLDLKQWTDLTASGRPALRCPTCGQIQELAIGETHSVSRGGRVSPAVRCVGDGCSFVDFVDLEAWGEAVLR